MGADDEHAAAHAASLWDCCTDIVWISSSVKPPSSRRSANSARPSSTGGLAGWPRSVESRLRSAPVARMPSKTCSQVHLPVWGVVKQRSSSAPALGERPLVGDREVLARELGMGDDDVADAGGERGVDRR